VGAASTYPILVSLPQGRLVDRGWGVLWLGMIARLILAIPHLLAAIMLTLLTLAGMVVIWIPILIKGRVPELWCKIVGELVSRGTRLSAYVLLFPGGYPPLEVGGEGPVAVSVSTGDRSINRLWGIPLLGLLARIIVVVPHIVILAALQVAMWLVGLLLWMPILINGRYAEPAMKMVGMCLRYRARVAGYVGFLPVPYPPLGELG
jgi:hypothetical protein